MSALITAPIARFDYRLRIAADLLRAAPRAEHLVVGGMALASAAGAWPFGGALYSAVAIPALLVLAALIRHHLDGLGARREALAAAGADPADALVIQVAGPLGATCVGAMVGLGACVALGRAPVHALAPLAVGVVAALLVRRAWIGAPALVAGSLGALATAALVRLATSGSPAAPVAEARSRASVHLVQPAASVWSAAWPTVLAAVFTLVAAQLVITRRRQIRGMARAVTAAAARRLIARSSA
ncbi:conserved hypothetical protein [Catenulispora acidiphila DSM 44928]|uniref:Uncharacterized protein n=1 Tax=Catenulispora acidiphila (strain DSM 44928 / JCM 14897 / NBRC 102108 / NRRL B-24433 / ID139908) TaxID=479433 RepID=C7QA64_CATAD|nr:hypothetical protein [Catenulispora acidiphila]ACU70462.1 conserved hypothetical protein [Catenulispora acidiphila DSM 44928]